MRTEHLTDEAIQQYVLDKEHCEPQIIMHMQQCVQCQAAAANYQTMFAALHEMPAPVFDFDLAAEVMLQLPPAKPGFSWGMFLIYLMTASFVVAAGVLSFIFKEYLKSFFSGMQSILVVLGGITVIALVIFQVMDLYKKYKRQINALDFQ
ncbi:MAG: hypothetical protein QM731_07960 [Chitinophagaceae bacterium]